MLRECYRFFTTRRGSELPAELFLDIPRSAVRTKACWVQAGQFGVVSLIGLVINSLVCGSVSYLFHPLWLTLIPDAAIAEIVNYNFSIIAAIGVVLF